MLLILLLAVIVLLAVFCVMAVSLTISKAINGFFFGIFGNIYTVVKIFTWIKKIFVILIIYKLFRTEKKLKTDKTKTEKVEVEAE